MNTNKPARWFRMYAEFASDPKVQMLSESYQRRYMMLLCLRCGNGDVTLHDTEVAFQLRIDEVEWVKTKDILIDKNLINKRNQPVAWDKRQFASDTSAERVAAYRARQKQQSNVTVTTPEKETEKETYTEKEKENPLDGFDEFWMIYDKKVEKPQAEKSWKRIKPTIELQLTIYAAARTYVASTPDKKYRKNPSTWLNNQCWNDEVVTEQRKVGFFGTLMNLGETQHEQLPDPFTPRLDG